MKTEIIFMKSSEWITSLFTISRIFTIFLNLTNIYYIDKFIIILTIIFTSCLLFLYFYRYYITRSILCCIGIRYKLDIKELKTWFINHLIMFFIDLVFLIYNFIFLIDNNPKNIYITNILWLLSDLLSRISCCFFLTDLLKNKNDNKIINFRHTLNFKNKY